MTMDPTSFSIAGAVPLDRLAPPPTPAGGAGGAGGASAAVYDVTDATFQRDVVERSTQVPVVLDFWASWCGPCKQLSPVLERLAAEAGGAWVLAKIDVDANPGLAQAFGVQGIPMVMAVVGGRPVELFTGAMPEAQIRPVLDQVVALAGQMGIRGGPLPDGPDADGEPVESLPAYELEAQDALDRGDLAAAAAAYDQALAEAPGDARARSGRAQVAFLQRLQQYGDGRAFRRTAADDPTDVTAALAVADLDLYGGNVEDAFDRLVDLVRRSAGDDRDATRTRLLELFDVVGPEDPRVVRARRALTSALF